MDAGIIPIPQQMGRRRESHWFRWSAPSLHSRPYAKLSEPRASRLSVRPFCRGLAGNSGAGRTTSLVQLPKSLECIERFERAIGRKRSITAQRRQFRVDSQHRQQQQRSQHWQ